MDNMPLEVQFQYARTMAEVEKMSPQQAKEFIDTLVKGYLYAMQTCREQAIELASHLKR